MDEHLILSPYQRPHRAKLYTRRREHFKQKLTEFNGKAFSSCVLTLHIQNKLNNPLQEGSTEAKEQRVQVTKINPISMHYEYPFK